LQGLGFVVLIAGLLFGTAGRLDLPFFWAFAGLNVALVVVGAFTVDPDLLQERMHPGPGGRDWLPLLAGVPLYVGHLVVAGLDMGRFHWSDSVPIALQGIALAVCTAAWLLVLWGMSVNRFFSSVVRIQRERGHHLVTAGPYQYVRHPGYLGGILGIVSGPLTLGSWWSLAIVLPLVLVILRRTALEDRFLQSELEGYLDYKRRVRYRLVPGIW
jgi:protein-S-isoprenylcysteine O-methyltransferase Ste14